MLSYGCNDTRQKTASNSKEYVEIIAPVPRPKGQNAEIVFCLDATGSMSGLISTAKEKIWNIVSDLAQSNDIDTLKMGMVFYRDRGDLFVTKSVPLTVDLDDAYLKLLEIEADGGGDSPESVNQGLYEAVTDMDWAIDKTTYRTIFVVGDCPPHMDYEDDVRYTESCVLAAEKGITINTIKLGGDCLEAITHFKKMSKCTQGEFLQLDQNAKDYVIETPYDHEVNAISRKIDESRLYYGSEEEQKLNYDKKAKSMEVYQKGSSTANSARASFKNSKSGKKSWMGSKEIVSDFKTGKVDLEEIEEENLPTLLKDKTTSQKEELIKKMVEERDTNERRLKELSDKRKKYIAEKTKELSKTDSTSFSKEVLKIMKKQSKSKK